MSKFFLTTPIYYVNAKPHIGSAYTTIAADVLARWHRHHGHDVFFLTGTAEHGAKITQAAVAAGQSPQEFVDANSASFALAWDTLNIAPDDFIRTTEPRHAAAVAAFFGKLKESGMVYEGEYEGLYCVGHEAFLKASELDANGLCPDHKVAPEKVKEKNWFFKLSAYQDVLREKLTSGEVVIEPQSRRNEVLSFLEQGLEDISISRQHVEFALPLPWDTTQTIYVWLDELFNYCSAIGYGADEARFRTWWPADVHLIGKDIIKFHCLIWPALLLAINEPLPKKIFAHGYFTVNGQKMSKSLGNVIDPVALAVEYGPDAIRYFLLRDIPFGNDGDFSPARLRERYNADLANGLGNLVSRTLTMFEKYLPEYDGTGECPSPVSEMLAEADQLVEKLQFDEALGKIWAAIAWADTAIEKAQPWQLEKSGQHVEVEELLRSLYHTLAAITDALAPFMPTTHTTLKELLAARPLRKPTEPLFARRNA